MFELIGIAVIGYVLASLMDDPTCKRFIKIIPPLAYVLWLLKQ